ncbi:DUF6602 domain-containing protein [Curtobacterium sp. MCSS17_007]|uniref:DUF6602 domain-containing protein n=1 Tax=Curtobacterium sp. MCSS17_007 TaxID=2175646 RepID=UPI0032E7F559
MTSVSRPDPAISQRLKDALATDEEVLKLSLSRARAHFNHSGMKGDAVEEAARDFLMTHLPRRFGVGRGEVIDRKGNRTSQLDILILNEDQPFNYPTDQPGVYLAEGVSAIGEVKSALTRTELADIVKKGAQVRALRVVPQKGEIMYSNPSDGPRYIDSFPYFAVATETTMSRDSILEALNDLAPVPDYEPEDASPGLAPLDALFVLGTGAFLNLGNGKGEISMEESDGSRVKGWEAVADDKALVWMFGWLDIVMPRRIRWSSIAAPYLFATTDGASRAPEPPAA